MRAKFRKEYGDEKCTRMEGYYYYKKIYILDNGGMF
jgi:hypothetical protein